MMKFSPFRLFSFFLAAMAISGCASPTEIVLILDMESPSQVESIRLVASGSGDSSPPLDTLLDFDAAGAPEFPASIAFVLEGEASTLTVDASATLRDGSTIERRVVTDFQLDRSIALPVYLLDICVDVECPDGQTCGDMGTCTSASISGGSLPEFSGDPQDFALINR